MDGLRTGFGRKDNDTYFVRNFRLGRDDEFLLREEREDVIVTRRGYRDRVTQ